MRHRRKKKMNIWLMVLLHCLSIAVGLLTFAWFHHVRDFYFPQTAPMMTVLLEATPTPTLGITPEPMTEEVTEAVPDTTATPAPVREGQFGERFADQFTDGEVVETENTYRSAHVNVTLTKVSEGDLTYHIAEIYVSDLKYLCTALGSRGYGSREMTADMAAANNAIVAISGDYYSARQEGIVVRNGVLYRENRMDDVCVLLSDGRMLTMTNAELDMDALKASAPWQVWCFGPRLLENGKAMTSFQSAVERTNPRSAIGYVEPGHYFFVQVDGRGAFGSRGMTLQELSALFEELGCETAYNLDGGQSAGIAWRGELISYAYGRSVSDIVYITDEP